MAMTEHRREAVRLAKVQEAAVVEKCRRSGAATPGYTFDELIGKGSYGRVYKGRQTSSQKVVAIKVIDIDDPDFRAVGDDKDEQINDFNKEIRILRQAQESGAPNLNQMIEASAVHSQLWLICEHCPGGSVKTLMRATNDVLGERYIIVTARELSKALKGLHDAGIMHRDIKAANVLIHEEGRLQLCDFGVATVLDKKTDKRKTFIGTLHWMPPELWDRDPEYSDEVDVWAFGCTLYECAVGKPPNADLREAHQLRSRMRRMNQSIELPGNSHHSSGLRSLVSYTLTPDAAVRPSFTNVLEHEYLANTEETHPTRILSELVQTYYSWLYGGGHRASLFMAGGAGAGDTPASLTTSDEEWNFSATNTFTNRMSTILNIPDVSHSSGFQVMGADDSNLKSQHAIMSDQLSIDDQANFEERVRRGADLSNIFDQNKPDYEYITKQDFVPIQRRRVSDLPLRVMSEERPYSIANQVIDLGDFDSSNYYPANPAKDERIKLADPATIKANRGNSKLYTESALSDTLTARPSVGPRRATRDFVFPSNEWNAKDVGRHQDVPNKAPKPRDPAKHKTMEWSFADEMSKVEIDKDDEDDSPAPIREDETAATTTAKPRKRDTMQWSLQGAIAEASAALPFSNQQTATHAQETSSRITPPIFHSTDELPSAGTSRASTRSPSESSPTSHLYSDALDPFAPGPETSEYLPPVIAGSFDERGVSSFYGRETGEGWTFHTDGTPEGTKRRPEVAQQRQPPDRVPEEERPEVTMPAIHPVDPRVLSDHDDYYSYDDMASSPNTILEQEFERLLVEMQGVLGGARAAMSIATATVDSGRQRGRPRERKGRTEKGSGKGDGTRRGVTQNMTDQDERHDEVDEHVTETESDFDVDNEPETESGSDLEAYSTNEPRPNQQDRREAEAGQQQERQGRGEEEEESGEDDEYQEALVTAIDSTDSEWGDFIEDEYS